MCGFVTCTCISHWKTLLQNVDSFQHMISNDHISYSHHQFHLSPEHHQLLRVLRSYQAPSVRYKFSKLQIFTWKLKFYHQQQIFKVVLLEVTDWFHLLLQKYLPNTQVWINIICQLVFRIQMALMNEMVSLACNSNPELRFPGQPIYLSSTRPSVYFSMLLPRN